MPQRAFGRGKVALLMTPTVSQESRPLPKSGYQQRGECQEISFFGLAIHPDVHRISLPHQTCDLPQIIPAALHIDILRVTHAAIFVQIHDLAVPSPRT